MIFSDEYDIACKERLREDLAHLTMVPNVVLDFTDVTYIDSTVLSELIHLHKVRAAKGYEREVIVVQNPHLQRLFDLVDFQEVFHFVAGLDQAVRNDGAPIGLYYAQANAR